MSTLTEIEAAIAQLPEAEVEKLTQWLEERRQKLARAEEWLEKARGTAIPGVTTEQIMSMTRGED